MAIGNGARDGDMQVGNRKLNWTWKGSKRILPVLFVVVPAYVLSRRRHVEHEEPCSGSVELHDRVHIFCVHRRHEFLLKRLNRRLVAGFCTRWLVSAD